MQLLPQWGPTYTSSDIIKGYGVFVDGRETLLYETPDGLYVTCASGDQPLYGFRYAGTARTDRRGKVQVNWVDP